MSKAPPYTSMTLKRLRELGEFDLIDICEKFVAFPPPGHRVDLFGILDIVCLGAGRTVGIQSTSVNQLSKHKKKLTESPNTRLVLAAGWEVWIYAWHKPARRWELRTLQFQLPKESLDG